MAARGRAGSGNGVARAGRGGPKPPEPGPRRPVPSPAAGTRPGPGGSPPPPCPKAPVRLGPPDSAAPDPVLMRRLRGRQLGRLVGVSGPEMAGFEPATDELTVRCSNPMSYIMDDMEGFEPPAPGAFPGALSAELHASPAGSGRVRHTGRQGHPHRTGRKPAPLNSGRHRREPPYRAGGDSRLMKISVMSKDVARAPQACGGAASARGGLG